MLAGRNVGLFVGVLTMGGKQWRGNEMRKGARGEQEQTSFSPFFWKTVFLYRLSDESRLAFVLCSSVASGGP